MGWFTNLVADLTGSSTSEVSRSHHQARDDSGVREGKDTDHFKSAPSDGVQKTESGVPLYPDR